ncbi:MAG: hypothetical protein B7X11_01135 [Acidobacteria bacterium 37-65-4]|nr:MAG: hypothetical protein B7X11_01135 [Acidobacteria bacterium 37-65-4]
MPRIPPPWNALELREREVANRTLPKAGSARAESRMGSDMALQSWPGSGPAMPAPSRNWEGIGNLNGVLPPDTQGDVGLNHYVQWVNLSLAIWDKSGTLVYGPVDGNTLWQGFGGPADGSNDGDPVVLYDRLADRWLISQFALPNYPGGPFYQYIAVSQSPDPTGSWYRYAFKVSDTKMNDYPKLGVWPDGYYMSVNQFDSAGNWAGAGVFAFDRAKMLAGDPSASFITFDLYAVDSGYGGMLPAQVVGPVPPPEGAPCPFAEVDDDAWGWPQDQLSLWQFHADWTTPSNSTFGLSGDPNFVLQTAPFDSDLCSFNACVTQQGVGSTLDTLSDRLMFRLDYLNFGDHQTLATCHTVDADGTDHAGVRWYELRDSGSGWSIYQQGTYAPDSEHRWMGSVGMDKAGDLAVGYSVSGTDLYPSIRYAGRVPGDPLGQLSQAEQTFATGAGAQTHSSGRWGDYSTMSLDPADDCTFWYTQEYYALTSSAGWQTRIGSFKFPECTPATGPLVTAQGLPTAGVAPLAVTFTASVSRGQLPYTYAWTFGDGSSGSGASVSHTYAAHGTYEARVTASDGAGATSSSSVYVSATVPPPVITFAKKVPNPLRLKVSGSNFHTNFTLMVNGNPIRAAYKNSTLVMGKGANLKMMLPKGTAVSLTIRNNDDGGISAPLLYTR